jgi:DNA-binding PadR family transcriptional regulator
MMQYSQIESQIPLREATLFILLSLRRSSKHGYAIMKDVRRLSEGRIVLSTGTLYGAIRRLLDDGWILRAEDGEATNDNRNRKVYSLTELGARILRAEFERLDNLVAIYKLQASREGP